MNVLSIQEAYESYTDFCEQKGVNVKNVLTIEQFHEVIAESALISELYVDYVEFCVDRGEKPSTREEFENYMGRHSRLVMVDKGVVAANRYLR